MIRWGIAGCGWVARDYVAPAIAASDNGTLAAFYDVSAGSLARIAGLFPDAASYSDLAGFLAAIDAVYIATPNDAHRPLVEAAARAGVPVLCEKPMATTLADAQAMVAACEGELGNFALRFHAESSCAVVMAANGYPGEPVAGTIIGGLEQASAVPGALVFHAGTRIEGGHVVAAGGRVLTLCGTGPDAAAARAVAYAAIDALDWPGGFCRRDIGA